MSISNSSSSSLGILQDLLSPRWFYSSSRVKVSYCIFGDPKGYPIVYCHGFPGSRVEAAFLDPYARKEGFSIVAVDRPGYGHTPSHPHRTWHDWIQPIQELIHHLGYQEVAVLGISGGGPYACVLAGLCPQLIRYLVLVCPLPPMREDLVQQFPLRLKIALKGWKRFPWLMIGIHQLIFRILIQRHPKLFVRFIMGRLPIQDREALSSPLLKEIFRISIEEAFLQGGKGIFEDLGVYTQPWPFSWEEIQAPVWIWHGQNDHVIPWTTSEQLHREMPHSQLVLFPQEGHFSLPIIHAHKILNAIRSK